jgi:hypothetical protein
MTLIKAYNFHIVNIKELVGINYAVNTVKRYSSSLNSLKEFMIKKYNKTDIRLNMPAMSLKICSHPINVWKGVRVGKEIAGIMLLQKASLKH